MSREELLKRKICPRCGKPFRWIYQETVGRRGENDHGRTYLYAVHEEIVEGKKKRRKCYLGPVDSYKYVSATHDLEFYGLIRDDRYIKYLEEILDLFASEEPISTDLDDFRKDFENVIRMRSLVKRINDEVEDRLRRINETMISDIKASINLLKRDYPDNPQAQEIVKELEAFDREIEKTGLVKSFVFLKEEAIRSFVEKYLVIKLKLKQFGL